MFLTKQKDITEISEGLIVHGCNLQKAMNSGVAKAIRNKYPKVFTDYVSGINSGKSLGDICFTKVTGKLYIANSLTQEFYGNSSQTGRCYVSYTALEKVFEKVNIFALENNLPVYFPKIGCGLAGGDWKIVSEIINKALDSRISKTLCLP
jgi:O-acetyl-ADP-ribose deacetylase (regulator of RNase III)